VHTENTFRYRSVAVENSGYKPGYYGQFMSAQEIPGAVAQEIPGAVLLL